MTLNERLVNEQYIISVSIQSAVEVIELDTDVMVKAVHVYRKLNSEFEVEFDLGVKK